MLIQRQWISTATGANTPRPTVRNVFTSLCRSMTHDRVTSPMNSIYSSEGSAIDQSETHGTRSSLHSVVDKQQRGVPKSKGCQI